MKSLPQQQYPITSIILPLSKDNLKVRPYTSREQKIMALAQETKEMTTIIEAIVQIISNVICDHNFNDMNDIKEYVRSIPLVDINFLLIHLRSTSDSNISRFAIEDIETGEEVELALDLRKVKVKFFDEHTDKIDCGDFYTIMRYTTLKEFAISTDVSIPKTERDFLVMKSCLDSIVYKDSEEVHYFTDHTDEEIKEWLESLSITTVESISNFFKTMPTIRHDVEYENSLGNKHVFVIEGTEAFFL